MFYTLLIMPGYHEAQVPQLYERSVRRVHRVLNGIWPLNVIDIENVPEEGPVIIVFSHRTNADGPVLGSVLPRALYGYGKKQVRKFPPAAIFLQKRGVRLIDRKNVTLGDIRFGLEVLDEGHLFGIAKEGTRGTGPQIAPTKSGAGYFAVKTELKGSECPVVPVGMSTEHLYSHPRRPINIVFGEPLRVDPIRLSTAPEKEVIKEFDADVHDALQRSFSESLDLQAQWEAGQEIIIEHPW